MTGKIVTDARAALEGLAFDGMTVMSGGFGLCGIPENLIAGLRDSGVKEVAIALREDSLTAKKVEAAGFKVLSNKEAAGWADILMILAPDEHQAAIWENDLKGNMKPGSALAFAHGLNVHFGLIEPRGPVVVVISGRNIDIDQHLRVLNGADA